MAKTLGPYTLRSELGRGAMAVVWRAWDPALEREVAIKEPLLPAGTDSATQAELGARFVREGKAAAKLNHPGIVTIYAADIYEGRPAIVMELIEGETLGEVLSRGALTAPATLSILDQLLDAVGYAHARGIVHRDIKPDNVFLTPEGRVKLADFGIAQVGSAATLTQAGTVLGTPGYMAPEQITGQPVDRRADLFAIGVLAYEMLAGRNPFGASEGLPTTTVMYRIVHEPVPELPPGALEHLPLDLGPVLGAALAKDPALRFNDAQAFRAALQGEPIVIEALPQTAGLAPAYTSYPGAPAAGLAKPEKERPTWLPYALVVGAAVLVLGGLFVVARGGPSGVAVAPPTTTTTETATTTTAGTTTTTTRPPATTSSTQAPVTTEPPRTTSPPTYRRPVTTQPTAPPSATRVAVTSYGASIELPPGWRKESMYVQSGYRTFKASGPQGSYVRFDQQVSWPGGTTEDLLASAQTLEAGLYQKYPDSMRTYSMTPGTRGGANALRWEFGHSLNGTLMRKVDTFFQPDSDTAPVAILVAVPESWSDSAKQDAFDMVNTFQF